MPQQATTTTARRPAPSSRMATSSVGATSLNAAPRIALVLRHINLRTGETTILTEFALEEKDQPGKPRRKLPQIAPVRPDVKSNVEILLGKQPISLPPEATRFRNCLWQPTIEHLPQPEALRKGFAYTETTWALADLNLPAMNFAEPLLTWMKPADFLAVCQSYKLDSALAAFTGFGLITN